MNANMKSYNATTPQVQAYTKTGELLIVVPVRYIPALGEPEEWCQRAIGDWRKYCPLGAVGERFKMRETWAINQCGKRVSMRKGAWPDGYPINRLRYPATDKPPIGDIGDYWWNKRPAITQPPWAVRHHPIITDITVKRVQDITDSEAHTTGIDIKLEWYSTRPQYKDEFEKLWNARHPKPGEQWPDCQCTFVRCAK